MISCPNRHLGSKLIAHQKTEKRNKTERKEGKKSLVLNILIKLLTFYGVTFLK